MSWIRIYLEEKSFSKNKSCSQKIWHVGKSKVIQTEKVSSTVKGFDACD